MTIKECKNVNVKKLNEKNIEDSIWIVYGILSKVLSFSKEELIVFDNKEITEEQEKLIKDYIDMTIQGVPLAYIEGKKEFMGYDIFLSNKVLIPRADTEILVENSIEILKKMCVNNQKKICVLDMCAGSGCIAVGLLLTLKKDYEQIYNKVEMYCVDISKEAIDNISENVERYMLQDRVKIIQSDLFKNIINVKFDIILSNPPYIKTKEIALLDKFVQSEPIIALDGGIDGLAFYKEISKESKKYLKKGGYILFEIGYDEAKDVNQILSNEGYSNCIIKKDLAGLDRLIISTNL